MAKREKNAESASVEAPQASAATPTFTISADSPFGRCVMFWAANEARHGLVKPSAEEKAAIIAKAREFDLYEEAVRTGKQ